MMKLSNGVKPFQLQRTQKAASAANSESLEPLQHFDCLILVFHFLLRGAIEFAKFPPKESKSSTQKGNPC